MTIGIIREGKQPFDRRAPLSPAHCAALLLRFPGLRLVVQPSPHRCFSDGEYAAAGATLSEGLGPCGLILGVKEVPIGQLLPGKAMMFFSHTIKKQPHNRELLREALRQRVTLMDYECLTDAQGRRLIGFGYYAGVAGAYHALRAHGLRTGAYTLPPPSGSQDMAAMLGRLQGLPLGHLRIVISGGGKVANGARHTMAAAGIAELPVAAFIGGEGSAPVFCNPDIGDYYERDGQPPASLAEFVQAPESYTSTFLRFAEKADVFISAHFWDGRSAPFFAMGDLVSGRFRPSVVADITCDVNGSVPTTVRTSTIGQPYYGISRATGAETPAFEPGSVTVVAVDNLPCEVPRDASVGFGEVLSSAILPIFLSSDDEGVLERATIARDGQLMPRFAYLQGYADGTA